MVPDEDVIVDLEYLPEEDDVFDEELTELGAKDDIIGVPRTNVLP